jgi:tRNA pseudouridine55 synthase
VGVGAVGVPPPSTPKATRLLQYLPEGKAYRAIIRLGVQTTTDDLEGEVIYAEPARDMTIDRVRAVIPQFIGKIEQTPPIYSAIKVDGQRLYKLARSGETDETVAIPTREVQIDSIDILNWADGDFPEVEVQIACGGGTYIRSIARDLGARLGTRGVLVFLERNASCGLRLADSITLEELERQQQAGTFVPVSPNFGLAHLPAVTLADASWVKYWSQGRRLALDEIGCDLILSGYVRVVAEDCCVGIGEVRSTESGDILIPQTVLN